MQLSTLFDPPPGLSASEAARRAGINRSTLHRIATGAVAPSLDTLRELAIVHGLDLQLTLTPLSDLDAAAAARMLFDPAFGDVASSEGAQQWVGRLERLGDDPLTILQTAGRAASLLHSARVTLMRGDASALRLASAGDASGGAWAVSGAAALGLGSVSAPQGPSVLWVEDRAAASAALQETHRTVGAPLNANVIVAEAPPWVFVDAYTIDLVHYVAPIQMILDGIGLEGELENIALRIAKHW